MKNERLDKGSKVACYGFCSGKDFYDGKRGTVFNIDYFDENSRHRMVEVVMKDVTAVFHEKQLRVVRKR